MSLAPVRRSRTDAIGAAREEDECPIGADPRGFVRRLACLVQKGTARGALSIFALGLKCGVGGSEALGSCGFEKVPAQGRSANCGDAGAELHRPLAARTRRVERSASWLAHRAAPEKEADPAQGAASGGAEEAEVAHGDKALGQDVKQPAADQLERIDRLALPPCVGAILEAQHDAAVRIKSGESALIEGGFADIGREVAQSEAAVSGGLTMGDPGLAPEGGIDLVIQLGMARSQLRGEALAHAGRECHDRQ